LLAGGYPTTIREPLQLGSIILNRLAFQDPSLRLFFLTVPPTKHPSCRRRIYPAILSFPIEILTSLRYRARKFVTVNLGGNTTFDL
jgi:hypothetical protein